MPAIPYEDIQLLKNLLAQHELDIAIHKLLLITQHSTHHHFSIQISGQYNDLKNQLILGVLSEENKNLEKNKIVARILDLLSKIEQTNAEPSNHSNRQEDTKSTIVKDSKNVLIGNNISIGGNLTFDNHE
jgi:hypothetical protein